MLHWWAVGTLALRGKEQVSQRNQLIVVVGVKLLDSFIFHRTLSVAFLLVNFAISPGVEKRKGLELRL